MKLLILLIRTGWGGVIFRLFLGVLNGVLNVGEVWDAGSTKRQHQREVWVKSALNVTVILEPCIQKKPPQINTQSKENQ